MPLASHSPIPTPWGEATPPRPSFFEPRCITERKPWSLASPTLHGGSRCSGSRPAASSCRKARPRAQLDRRLDPGPVSRTLACAVARPARRRAAVRAARTGSRRRPSAAEVSTTSARRAAVWPSKAALPVASSACGACDWSRAARRSVRKNAAADAAAPGCRASRSGIRRRCSARGAGAEGRVPRPRSRAQCGPRHGLFAGFSPNGPQKRLLLGGLLTKTTPS